MKKKQNKSVRASALQITLALGLISISAILFASGLTAAYPAATADPATSRNADSAASRDPAPTAALGALLTAMARQFR